MTATPCGRKRCPHLETPFDDCYVNGLGSADVEKAIDFCGGDYEQCEIYARIHVGSRETAPARAGFELHGEPGAGGRRAGMGNTRGWEETR